jgi:cytochrome P450
MHLSIDDIVRHSGLASVINESMRLYPPAWVSDRVSLEDDKFKGYTFPKETIIVLFYFGLHRNEKYWPDASAFKPDRFNLIDSDQVPRGVTSNTAYYPFGAGPRLCIGNNFAMAEMAIFLHAFVHEFNIEPTRSVPKMNPMITLRPEGIILDIKRRAT